MKIHCIILSLGFLFMQEIAWSQTAISTEEIQLIYEANGFHFEQVEHIVALISEKESEELPALMEQVFRVMQSIQKADAPVPMETELLNTWVDQFQITSEQAQDVYKVAIRFALEGNRR